MQTGKTVPENSALIESMAADEQVRHRPGVFKQQNKSHKTGRHRSKGQINKECQGTDTWTSSFKDKTRQFS